MKKYNPLQVSTLVGMTISFFILVEIIIGSGINNVEAAGGNTLYVGGSGPGNYTKIQDAIDNASNGDTIFVYNGTYYENIVINKSIDLIGENTKGTIINGGGVGDVIFVNETRWVNISNFCVTNSGSNIADAGIDVFHSSNITLKNINVSGNERGIYMEYSSDNEICYNTIVNNYGVGLMLVGANIEGYYCNNNYIYDNVILNNSGIGIDIQSYSLYNNIYNNICNENGYDGIYIEGYNNLVNNNTCSNNAHYGIHLKLSSGNNITNNTCDSNLIYGIYLENADNNYIYNNTCLSSEYGIYVDLASSNNNISSSICTGNTIAGIYTKEANSNIIWRAFCSSNEYGIFLVNASGVNVLYSVLTSNKDGILVTGTFSVIDIHYNNISGNIRYGINNTAAITVNAEHNWWGDVSGPYDPSNDTSSGGLYNPGGSGDNVTDYVDYYPWWDSPTGSIPPEISDNTPASATTGDSFTFNATVTDNIAVSNVYVEYWYGTGSHTNVSMSNVAGDYYEYTITVAHTLDTLHYIIAAVDSSGNWNNTGTNDVTISDNDKPEISDVMAYPNPQREGHYVNISCEVFDNIDVGVVMVNITYPDGSAVNVSMLEGNRYYYNVTYTQEGEYYYFIWAEDISGNSNISSLYQFEILPNIHPIADFTYTPSHPTTKDTLQFVDASYDPDGFIVNWTWNFGDGNISYEQNPQHIYADNGVYTVTLTVRDNDGAESTASKDVTVLNIPPVANFTYYFEDKQTVIFHDSSFDVDGSIVNWTWIFGDGNVSYKRNPIHIYNEGGDHIVTLIVTDDDGASDTISKALFVDLYPPHTTLLIKQENENEWRMWDENLSEVYSGNLLLGFLAEDYGSGIAHTMYSKDGGVWREYQAPLHVLEEGRHVVEYYSIDEAGNMEESKIFSFVVDKTPPYVRVVYPNGGDVVEGTINICWISTDLTNVSISIYYSSDNGLTWHLIVENEDNDGEYAWNTSDVKDGVNYLIKVVAKDEAGNSNEDTSDSAFVIYNTRIDMNILHPRKGYLYINDREIFPLPLNATITIGKITVIPELKCGLPVQRVEFYIDENLKFSDKNAPYEWVWDEISYCFHTLRVIAYDILGNMVIQEMKIWAFNL